ncbi:hypothetical protein POV27_11645 [Aureisphaera galaxeae]|uniref:coiled-coil domain-containing protein n=1 Tax=Aureisphaera galaxeae TaxID=1538023 RepID=UPI002350EE6F|nr:hypothetical protein [Aureisphaera galaxeae]MDC8004706.1 hypothetical protein [Aureisphaera galaxeae]
MRKLTLLCILFVSTQFLTAQRRTNEIDSTHNNITTTVIDLDLSRPEYNSVEHSGNEKSLVADAKSPIAFRLSNGNPFRYTYVLDFKKVNLFSDIDFNFERTTDTGQSMLEEMKADGTAKTIEELQKDLEEEIVKLDEEISIYIAQLIASEVIDFDDLRLKRKTYVETLASQEAGKEEIQAKIDGDASATDAVKNKQKEIESKLKLVEEKIKKLLSAKNDAYLLPIDVNGDNIDYVEVQLDVYELDATVPQTYTYKVWIRGGFKIDFSGGAFITSLFDQTFSTAVVTEDDGNGNNVNTDRSTIRQDDLGDYDFGLGMLVNITYRSNGWVKPSLNFGTLVTDRQSFQLLAGGGLILGKNERWVFHAGVSMGRVDVLKNGFEADGETEYVLDGQGNVPTNEKFKFGHYFGVTYNLSSPKSNK